MDPLSPSLASGKMEDVLSNRAFPYEFRIHSNFEAEELEHQQTFTVVSDGMVWNSPGEEPCSGEISRPQDQMMLMLCDLQRAFSIVSECALQHRVEHGFHAKLPVSIDITTLIDLVTSSVTAMGNLYYSIHPTTPVAIGYKGIIANSKSVLKGFLLAMQGIDSHDGLNSSDVPVVAERCIHLEHTMAAEIQQLELLHMQAGRE